VCNDPSVNCSYPINGKQLAEVLMNIYQETNMSAIFARFMNDESGATAIEYGLIAALISVALITGAGALGNSLNNQFQNLSTKLNTTAS
jgi:pilus assembly protein Flp/PilA